MTVEPSDNKENEDVLEIDRELLMRDVDDDQLLADVLKEQPHEYTVEECTVVIDGLPLADKEKLEKLRNVVSKLYRQFQDDATASFPVDEETGKCKGYCFIEFDAPEDARAAVAGLNGHRLDKKHQFTARILADLLTVAPPEKEWKEPEPKPFKEPGSLWYWLEDEKCVDQYAMLEQNMLGKSRDGQPELQQLVLTVFSNTVREPKVEERRVNWTQAGFRWSPRGAYLATMHEKGIQLWGAGKNSRFDRLGRFAHDEADEIDFSPCERYLVTFSRPKVKFIQHIADEDALRVWDILSGDLLRKLPVGGSSGFFPDSWPFLRWSPTSSFMACRRSNEDGGLGIAVYEMPSCTLVGKKVISMPGVVDLQWSPTDDYLAYWVAENDDGTAPARFAIYDIHERVDVGTRNVFRVVDARLHWQRSGDRLAVEVTRYGKKKLDAKATETTQRKQYQYSQMSHQLEVFHVRARDIPVDTVELSRSSVPDDLAKRFDSFAPVAFAWEPSGDKFCVLLGSERVSAPIFYQCYSTKTTNKITQIKTLEAVQSLNTVQWAPQGNWLVIAARRTGLGQGGTLIFVDTGGAEITKAPGANPEHVGFTHMHFDPTGRYLATVVSMWDSGGKSGDYGIRIWSSQGRPLRKINAPVAMFAWRPRPPSCLSEEKLKAIKKNMKSYAERFAAADEREAGRASQEVIKRRRQLMDMWRTYHKDQESVSKDDQEMRVNLRPPRDEKKSEKIKEKVKVLIEEKTETLEKKHVRTEEIGRD